MRALILETGHRVPPFLDSPQQALFGNSTVGATIEDSLRRRGFTTETIAKDTPVPACPGPCAVLADTCFVSDKALGDFLGLALPLLREHKAWRLALARTPVVDFLAPVSSVTFEPLDESGPGAKSKKPWRAEALATERALFDCFFVEDLAESPTATACLQTLRESARPCVVPKRELGIPLRLPVLGSATEQQQLMPLSSTVAGHIEHWTHILWLNQLAFGVCWLTLLRRHPLWALARTLLAFPWGLPRLMKRFVWQGQGCQIHPTAHVEASILGDNVVIGARASVRNSILGDGVVVGDHATVLSSTLGNQVRVSPRTFVVWSAAYPEAVLTNYKLQVSLIGKGAALSTWAGFIDAKLQGTIDVRIDGETKKTGRSFLGSCLGHRSFVGAKVLLLPGREIPNDTVITMRPDELICEIPKDLPPHTPVVRHEGTLVPLAALAALAPTPKTAAVPIPSTNTPDTA
jgi:acetyltransferase-like isoleucine patch superfamily enzyme